MHEQLKMFRRAATSLQHNLSLLTIGSSSSSSCPARLGQAWRLYSSDVTTEVAPSEKTGDAFGKSSRDMDRMDRLTDRPRHVYSREVLEKFKFDAFPYYIERNWDKEGKRLTFWATFRMLRDVKARKICREHGPERMRYKVMRMNNILPQVVIDEFAEKMLNMPKYAHPQRINMMCTFTGRTRGKIKRFRVNRHIFRRLADHGMLSGVQRGLWNSGRNMHR